MNVPSFSLFLLAFFGFLNIVNAYYLPNSYQRYMDENQAILRNLLAEAEQVSSPKEQQLLHKTDNDENKMPSPPHALHPDVKIPSSADNLVPRRDQRQFFFAPQYKRMRPCFYSPIQCLMKRSEVLDA